MKRGFAVLTAIGFVLTVASTAQAVSIAVDIVQIHEYLLPGESITYQHDITDPTLGNPFNPDTDTIISADLYIVFGDDCSLQFMFDQEAVSIYMDGSLVESRVLPDGWWEMVDFGIEIEHFDVGFAYLQDDGILDITLTAENGDFDVVMSKLIVRHLTGAPEPATVVLIALGGLGLALGTRRKARS